MNGMPMYRPYLQPTYGLGQQARTAGSILISSPRNKIGSQGRIYAYYRTLGQGQEYINYLSNTLGNIPQPTR
jgi:hypothetical protein